MTKIMNHIDLLLFIVLVVLGYCALAHGPWWGIGLDQTAAAGLAGALFGGAALLLGNWINRANDRCKAIQERAGQIEKLRTTIAAELVNVARGLIYAKRFVDKTIISTWAGGHVSETLDMSPYRPRQMPFTDSLDTKLLVLKKEEIDAITTLRSNVDDTRQSMDEITAGAHLNLLKATRLSGYLGRDMTVLAEVFAHIAPTRKLHIEGAAEPEFATKILKREAISPAEPVRR